MKTHQQIKSLECEAFLINLKELVEKIREKVKSPKNCKGIVKFVVLDVYQVFPSLTTGIYSLTLSSPNRLRQTLLDPKKRLFKR